MDWFFFVNGVEADKGAAEWRGLARRPHPVGPPRLERRHARARDRGRLPRAVPERAWRASGARCGWSARSRRRAPCEAARDRLEAAGVSDLGLVARRARHGGGHAAGGGALAGARGSCAAPPRSRTGPEESGVFARFARDGSRLELLDEHGEHGPRACSAATAWASCSRSQPRADELVWLVTALDDAGRRGRGARARRGQAARRVRGGRDRRHRREASAEWASMSLDPRLPQPAERPPRRARRRGRGVLRRARAHGRALPPPARARRRRSRAIVLAGMRGGGRARDRAARSRFALPFALLIAIDQPARVPRGRHAAVPRRRAARPPDRHHARGHRRGARSTACA